MSKNDQEEALDKILTGTLGRILDFIKFAEAKNGALVTLCSGWLIAIATMLSSEKVVPYVKIASVLATPFFVVGAAVALWSFFPKINLQERTRLKSTRHKPNLLFFGDIAELEYDDYQTQVRNRYLAQPDRSISDDYLGDLCIQVAVVSEIAKSKFKAFEWALRIAGIGMAILALTIAVSFFKILGETSVTY